MGAGGIIQQRVAAMLLTVGAPCFFDELPAAAKARVNAIDGKPFVDRDAADLKYLIKVVQALSYLC